MKKLFKFMIPVAALAITASCSNDDSTIVDPVDPGHLTGDVTAYLTVNIQDAGTMISKANSWDNDQVGSAADGDLVHGDENEHKINSARFFFYDKAGLYMTECSVWSGGAEGTTANIEYMGHNLLVLENLTAGNYPEYMICGLNLPENFQPGDNLDATRKALLDIRNSGLFVMSTTSFLGTNASDQYGTNQLKTENFKLAVPGQSPSISDEDKVEVFVERLAAKVQVVIEPDADQTVEEVGDDMYFVINATVGGNDNDEDLEGEQHAGLSKVYVKISKWGLTATRSQSYLTKDISDFTEKGATAPWDVTGNPWNSNDFYRSFWGKSVGYGADVADGDLNFTSFGDVANKVGDADYCHENTNTAEYLYLNATNKNVVSQRKVTSVIFTAQAFEKDEEGEFKPLNMVRFNGLLYRENAFLAYVLNSLENRNLLNYWKVVKTTTVTNPNPDPEVGGVIETTTNEYGQLDATDLKAAIVYANDGTGMVYVESGLAAADNVEYYTRAKDENGVYKYTKVTFDQTAIDTLNDNLRKFYNNNASLSVANAYEKGAMFYTVPIEHLLHRTSGENEIVEGNYGVVRNHWYRVSVNSVSQLGTGVFKPGEGDDKGEVIIPGEKETQTYRLGASINVLSWKIVKQKVDL